MNASEKWRGINAWITVDVDNWWTTFSNFQTWAGERAKNSVRKRIFHIKSKYRANDWSVLDKIEWNMAEAKTEIVCDAWEQVKVAASAHWGLERGKEA